MTTTRKELEQYVCAWNKYLKESVHNMDLITLLRNAAPNYRGYFALTLYNEKQISKEVCKEFYKIVGG
jgi:hypothetical protein